MPTSLETVLNSIAEQRQVFKGADHAFMWKPKLRIPDICESRYPLPGRESDSSVARWRPDLDQVRAESAAASKAVAAPSEADHTHTEIQGCLRDLGLALGFQVWIASNDGARSYKEGRLSDGCLDRSPAALAEAGAADTIRIIHVLWIEQGGDVPSQAARPAEALRGSASGSAGSAASGAASSSVPASGTTSGSANTTSGNSQGTNGAQDPQSSGRSGSRGSDGRGGRE